MNRDIIRYAFPMYRNVKHHKVVIDVVDKKKDATDELFDVIYAPDEFTGLPKCDVALYFSDNVDPMIREFIASNLMQPNPNPSGVPDADADLLHDLVRGSDESVSDYALRVRGIIENDNAIRLKEQDVSNVVNETK